jgi:signal transduction histidine kinase
VLDWRQLQRWGIAESRVPPGSEVRYRMPSLWDQYRGPVAGALAVGAAQAALIAGLLVERRHRRRAQSALAARQRDLEARTAEVRALAGRLLVAQEEERTAIARELHDEVGQALTTIKINLDTMRVVGAADPEAQAELLDDGVQLVDEALEQVRDLSLLLHPAMLDHLGLEAALRWLLHSQSQRAGYEVSYQATPLAPPPSPAAALICYRVAQEALTNVARHARASHVRVDLSASGGWLRLIVADDGAGFDPVAMRARARTGGSMGLLSLEERAALGGGALRLDTAPGRGTTLTLRLPLAAGAAAAAPAPPPAPAPTPTALPAAGG